MSRNLTAYRVMATIVGVLLVVLILVGVPLANFDGTSMWGVFDSTPAWVTTGSDANRLGESITTYLGVAHGWLYMIFLFSAFALSRRAKGDGATRTSTRSGPSTVRAGAVAVRRAATAASPAPPVSTSSTRSGRAWPAA